MIGLKKTKKVISILLAISMCVIQDMSVKADVTDGSIRLEEARGDEQGNNDILNVASGGAIAEGSSEGTNTEEIKDIYLNTSNGDLPEPEEIDNNGIMLLAATPTAPDKTITSYDCTGMTEIPDNFFMECRNLERVTGINGITKIGASGLRGCPKLRQFGDTDGVIDASRVSTFGNYALFACGHNNDLGTGNKLILKSGAINIGTSQVFDQSKLWVDGSNFSSTAINDGAAIQGIKVVGDVVLTGTNWSTRTLSGIEFTGNLTLDGISMRDHWNEGVNKWDSEIGSSVKFTGDNPQINIRNISFVGYSINPGTEKYSANYQNVTINIDMNTITKWDSESIIDGSKCKAINIVYNITNTSNMVYVKEINNCNIIGKNGVIKFAATKWQGFPLIRNCTIGNNEILDFQHVTSLRSNLFQGMLLNVNNMRNMESIQSIEYDALDPVLNNLTWDESWYNRLPGLTECTKGALKNWKVACKGENGYLEIPAKFVGAVGKAFHGNSNVIRVNWLGGGTYTLQRSNNGRYFGDEQFGDCKNLEEINFPNAVTFQGSVYTSSYSETMPKFTRLNFGDWYMERLKSTKSSPNLMFAMYHGPRADVVSQYFPMKTYANMLINYAENITYDGDYSASDDKFYGKILVISSDNKRLELDECTSNASACNQNELAPNLQHIVVLSKDTIITDEWTASQFSTSVKWWVYKGSTAETLCINRGLAHGYIDSPEFLTAMGETGEFPSVLIKELELDIREPIDMQFTVGLGTDSNKANGIKRISIDNATDIPADKWSLSGTTVTLKGDYLATVPKGSHKISVEFDNVYNTYADSKITLNIVDNGLKPSVSTQSVEFDINNQEDSIFYVNLGEGVKGATAVNRLVIDNTSTIPSEQWSLSGTMITVKKAYLSTLDIGSHTVKIEFNDKNNTSEADKVTMVIIDKPYIAVQSVEYNLSNTEDKIFNIQLGSGNNAATSITSISNNGVEVAPTLYNLVGTKLTISKEYLATLPKGMSSLTVVFNDIGATEQVNKIKINVVDKPAIQEQTVIFNVDEPADVSFGVLLGSGDEAATSITRIKLSEDTTLPNAVWSLDDNVVIIQQSYLQSLEKKSYYLTVEFNDPANTVEKDKVTLEVIDSGIKPSIPVQNIKYDRDNPADGSFVIALGSGLNGASAVSSIIMDALSYIPADSWSAVGNRIIITETYLDTLAKGKHSLTVEFNDRNNVLEDGKVSILVIGRGSGSGDIVGDDTTKPPIAVQQLRYQYYKDYGKSIVIPININRASSLKSLYLESTEIELNTGYVFNDLNQIVLNADWLKTVDKGEYRLIPEFNTGDRINNLIIEVYDKYDDRLLPYLLPSKVEYTRGVVALKMFMGQGSTQAKDVNLLVIDNYTITKQGKVYIDSNVVHESDVSTDNEYFYVDSPDTLMLMPRLIDTLGLEEGETYDVGCVFDNSEETASLKKVELTMPKSEDSTDPTPTPVPGSSSTPVPGVTTTPSVTGTPIPDATVAPTPVGSSKPTNTPGGSGGGSSGGGGAVNYPTLAPSKSPNPSSTPGTSSIPTGTPSPSNTPKPGIDTTPKPGDEDKDTKPIKTFFLNNIRFKGTDITKKVPDLDMNKKITVTLNDVVLDKSYYTLSNNKVTIKAVAFRGLTDGDAGVTVSDEEVYYFFKVNILRAEVETYIPYMQATKYLKKGSKFKVYLNNSNKIKKVEWRSSRPKIASVNKKGLIKAKKLGSSVVTCVVTNKQGKVYKFEVKINVINKKGLSENINLTDKEYESQFPVFTMYKYLHIGKSIGMNISNLDKNSIIQYKINDKSIAKVNKDGKITGKKKGDTWLTVTLNQNGEKYIYRLRLHVVK